MDIEEIREYCLQKPYTTESFPFGTNSVLVFKVNTKIFLLYFLGKYPNFFNVKTNPEWSEELREHYPQITGGYHMNKIHWNSVISEGLPKELIIKLIDQSYDLVSKKKLLAK